MKKLLAFIACLPLLQPADAQTGVLDNNFGGRGYVTANLGANISYNNTGTSVLTGSDGSIYLVFDAGGLTVIAKKHADGSTDVGYGGGGYSNPAPVHTSKAIMQADGKIIVVGYTGNPENSEDNARDFAIARFNLNGTLDNSFGTGGVQVTDFGYNDVATAATLQPNGYLIVSGAAVSSASQYNAIARYNTSGNLDETFGAAGTTVSMDFGTTSYYTSVAIQPDGKIVAAGSGLIRYNSNGVPDNSFGVNGFSAVSGEAHDIAIEPGGKILLAGNYYQGADILGFSVWRYTATGEPDNSFAGDGVQTINFGSPDDNATSIRLIAGGKILVGGTAGGSNTDFAVARFNNDGTPDNSFSGDGSATTDYASSNDYINAIQLQSDGKLLAVGYTVNAMNTYIAAARYNTDGTPDNSFDVDGTLTDHVINQGSTVYTCTAVQPNGKLLAGGYAWNGANYDFLLVRYNINGSLDNSFSADGRVTVDFSLGDDKARAIAVQADGKILLAGSAGDNFGLARFNSDGSPDVSFQGTGRRTSDLGASDSATVIILLPGGKFLLAGSGLARYNADGSPDLSFDEDGMLVTPFNCNAAAVQPDGKIIIAGGNESIHVNRYNADGTLDDSFANGVQLYYGDGSFDVLVATSMAIATDGKILIGGYYSMIYRHEAAQFALARLNGDGTVDDTFNNGGIVFSDVINFNNYATSMLLQSDKKLLLGGYSYNGTSNDFTIARYNEDGTLDNSFSGDGFLVTSASTANDRITAMALSNNYLYAVGYGEYPGKFGVAARYLLGPEGGPLPVTLVDLKATLQGTTTLLEWQTASEQDLSGFSIERSNDGLHFSPIGFVKAVGNSNGKLTYNSIDPAPLAGVNYYRLKMTDIDARFSYSKTVSVNAGTSVFSMSIYPNPVQDILFVRPGSTNQRTTLLVVDMNGRILKRTNIVSDANNAVAVPITNLPKGVYNLVVKTAQGTVTRSFVKE